MPLGGDLGYLVPLVRTATANLRHPSQSSEGELLLNKYVCSVVKVLSVG
jgi:hypothetical protein